MWQLRQWKIRILPLAAAGALALGAAGYAAPAGAATAARSAPARSAPARTVSPRAVPPAAAVAQQDGGISPKAAAGTPELSGGPYENVQQLVQCGNTMYAVGKFTSISQRGITYTRDNIFSFRATAPFTITSWAPDVNGQVSTIAFDGSYCAYAYIGGSFSSVNGTRAQNIAEISTSTGNVVPAFRHAANYAVSTMIVAEDHVLVGGEFTNINGSRVTAMVSLNPVNGKNDGFLNLNISGIYDYCTSNGSECTHDHQTAVRNQQLSHSGTLDLVEGIFTSVGGQVRRQIFMLNLATDPASVTAWTSPQWDGSEGNEYPYLCMPVESFYIRAAAWSPDDSTVYIVTTGFHPVNLPTGSYPRTGLCDAAAAFPATQGPVTDDWIEYTGCDSYFAVAADDTNVYVAGHQRWAENPDGCNFAGKGAIKDYGLQGLNPANGDLDVNTDGKPVYSMSRANADDELITSAGMWIASSNRHHQDRCTTVRNVAGICFLPYPTSSRSR